MEIEQPAVLHLPGREFPVLVDRRAEVLGAPLVEPAREEHLGLGQMQDEVRGLVQESRQRLFAGVALVEQDELLAPRHRREVAVGVLALLAARVLLVSLPVFLPQAVEEHGHLELLLA